MKSLHAKSLCCGATVRRFGDRRRQCSKCRKTWRIRVKKRGRDLKRARRDLVIRFFEHALGSAKARSRYQQWTERTLQRHLERSRDLFARITPWPQLPQNPVLIIIADAMVRRIRRQWYTVYCMLIRSPDHKEAVIIPPVIMQGIECQSGWQHALATIPPETQKCLRAMVCDGHRGLVNYAKQRRLIIQRCHFHLLSHIQRRRSRWAYGYHREEARKVFEVVERILTTPHRRTLNSLLIAADNLALETTSRELQKALRGFVNNAEDFRSYIYHPKLHLPTTSNTAESFIGCINELLHRLRGVSSPESFALWIEALAKYKATITCNGFHQPKNCR